MITLFQLPAQLYTVAVRQHDIQHNQVCRVPPKLFPCFGGSPRPEHLITVQESTSALIFIICGLSSTSKIVLTALPPLAP